MGKELFELFGETIKKKYILKRKDRKWKISENNVTIKFKTLNNKSFGFSVDAGKTEDVFVFFGGSPPKDIAKMCDGIITLKHKKEDYIFLIEQKTNNKDYYKKQLINGWHFCQWLLSLLKEYNYYDSEVKYIGLLYRVRKNVNKGLSTHPNLEVKSEKNGIKFFETNEKITHLTRYIEVIE